MTKQELRSKYKSLRKELSHDIREESSIAIANSVLSLPVWGKEYYHVFLPIVTQNEVNTEPILSILSGKDKNIVLSKSNLETSRMTHFLLTDNTVIKTNAWNIPEPTGGINIASNSIEVVFIPLLAFDGEGNRVGYGKGFYDSFLSDCKPETIKIGLSFFEAERKIKDINTYDIKLNYCVTPKRIYKF